MTIDNNVFSVDFRDGVDEATALATALRIGLEVVKNFYSSKEPYNQLLVIGSGDIFEIGRDLSSQVEVSKVYSEGTGHINVNSPELSYQEMRHFAERFVTIRV